MPNIEYPDLSCSNLIFDYPRINFVEKHSPREYSSFCTDSGVTLCDKQSGAFLVLRYPSDLENLKKLLDKIEIKE